MRIARVAIVLFFLPIGGGHAAMGKIPFAALVGQAELIVQGRVESVVTTTRPPEASPSPGQKREVEFVVSNVADLAVDTVLKGPVGIRRIRIEFHSMEDSPRYKPGETVVVFLTKAAQGDLYSTVGMLQGRFLIRDGMVEREQIPVAEFFHRIRTLIHAPSQPGR